MQVNDRSKFRDEQGLISLENRIRGTVKYGFSWYGEMQAQEFIARQIGRILGDDHFLLRNVPLVGTDVLASMILFSPQGIRLLHPSAERGNYRATEDEWMSFSGRSRQFKPTRPNLQFRALALARGLRRYFEAQGYALPDLEAVLIFTNPQTLVDRSNPQARIVLADAIELFASSLLERQQVMDHEDIQMLMDALLNPKLPQPEPEAEREPEQAEGEKAFDSEALKPMDTRPDLRPVRRYGSLNVRQWVVLGVLALFEFALLLAIGFTILGDRLLN
ncbi:MAG: hypothetical protein AABY97_05985 [Chloroflexota bacterium]